MWCGKCVIISQKLWHPRGLGSTPGKKCTYTGAGSISFCVAVTVPVAIVAPTNAGVTVNNVPPCIVFPLRKNPNPIVFEGGGGGGGHNSLLNFVRP